MSKVAMNDLLEPIALAFRKKGFPCAHLNGSERRESGVIKIIEGGAYDIEIGLGKSTRDANIDGGIGVCLFVKKNPGRFDYKAYFDDDIKNCQSQNGCIIKYGASCFIGVIAKCWLRDVNWKSDGLDKYVKRLFDLFDKFHKALSKLVTVDGVRDAFLFWAMDQRMQAAKDEQCAWAMVRKSLNNELEKAVGNQVGELAFVTNLNYLELERYIDGKEGRKLLDDAVEKWFIGCDDFSMLPVRSGSVAMVKRALINNAYCTLFNAFFKDRMDIVSQWSGKIDSKKEVIAEISKMHATEYLIKMLARSQNGKKYENYVVTGIWNRIYAACKISDRDVPRIVTQQLVRREGDRRALIDLYFPEIELAVECDESQHQVNIVDDALREEDIIKSGLIRNRQDLYRVDATGSYVDMDGAMDKIVAEVMNRLSGSANIVGLKSPVDIARSKNELAANDGLLYQGKSEALEALGIRRWKGGPLCSQPFADGFYDEQGCCWRILFLDVDKNNKGKGWQVNGADIAITHDREKLQKGFGRCMSEDNVIVFAAEPNNCGYSFVGTYRLEGDSLKYRSSVAPLFVKVFDGTSISEVDVG